MKVTVIQCPKCLDVIYSRASHDCRSCSCGEVSIDGGFDYIAVNFYERAPNPYKIDIGDVTKKELYDDWNKGIDKYGIIKKSLGDSE